MSLVGITFLVSGDFGTRCLFRFPPANSNPNETNNPSIPRDLTRSTPDDEEENYQNKFFTNNNIHLQPNNYQDDIFGIPENEFARICCPNNKLCSTLLNVKIEKYRFLSYPIRSKEITCFNIVFIFNEIEQESYISIYTQMIVQLIKTLEYEQRRNNFISLQAQMMFTVREK
jgi:hypothetical protein